MWARRYLALFLLLFWSPLILLYLVNTDTVSAKVKVPWHGETVEQDSNWRSLLSFLFPTTCIINDYQKVVACNNKSHISKGECLKSKCCFSSSGTIMRCYAPLRDKPAQMFRVFGFAVIGMIVLGCLPMYCYSFCRRRWFNPLRRKMNRLLRALRKRKNKRKKELIARRARREDRRDRR